MLHGVRLMLPGSTDMAVAELGCACFGGPHHARGSMRRRCGCVLDNGVLVTIWWPSPVGSKA